MRILHVYLTKELAYEDFMEMHAHGVCIPELTFIDTSGDVNALVYPGVNPVTWADSYDEVVYYDDQLNITDVVSNEE